ncbi:MAG TPA: hypothetical protein VGQ57_09565 [Polyangiaceae bacterium]|jgi:YVTN family beta-propeller protein|nr:hypothetical protein [Polyangiaceae bacterium]
MTSRTSASGSPTALLLRRSSAALRGVTALAGALALAIAPACGGDPERRAGTSELPAFPSRREVFPVGSRALAYVTNGGSDTVSVVDLDAFELLATVPVGLDPIDPDGPSDLALDAAAGTLYVVLSYPAPPNEGPHAAHHGLTRHGFVEALSLGELRPLGALEVDTSPSGLALGRDGGTLLVVHDDIDRAAQLGDDIALRRAALWAIAPAAGIAQGTANARAVNVCAAPYTVNYAAADARAIVTCSGEDSLAVVDPGPLTVLARVPVAAPRGGVSKPQAAAREPSGTALAVSSSVARAVTLYRAEDMAVRFATAFDGSPGVPDGVPYFAAWLGGSRLVVPLQSPDGAALLDAGSGAVLAATSYGPNDCGSPRQAVATAAGRVFMLCEGDHFTPGSVVELAPDTLEVLRAVPVDLAPDRMAVLLP